MTPKTRAQIIAEFDRNGMSVSSWAAAHGVSRQIVDGVLKGKLKGRRGHAHNVAVMLGLKDGVVADVALEERKPSHTHSGE